jgi:hypothetical protein
MKNFLILFFLITIFSCSDSLIEKIEPKAHEEIFVKNGRLVFPNSKSYFETILPLRFTEKIHAKNPEK